jgi:hypothetical protein
MISMRLLSPSAGDVFPAPASGRRERDRTLGLALPNTSGAGNRVPPLDRFAGPGSTGCPSGVIRSAHLCTTPAVLTSQTPIALASTPSSAAGMPTGPGLVLSSRTREVDVTTDAPFIGPAAPWCLHCPRCGLSIPLTSRLLVIAHCPRCVARHRVIVELLSSGRPADPLLATSSLQKPSTPPLARTARPDVKRTIA